MPLAAARRQLTTFAPSIARPAPRPARSSTRRTVALVAILLVAMLIRVPFALHLARQPGFAWTWGGEQFSIAHALVVGEGFSSPFGGVTGPTAQQVPVFPALVASLARLAGGSMEAAARAVLGLNLLWSGLTALVLVAVADRLRPGAGLAAGGLWAVIPSLGFSEVGFLWDTALYTCVLAALLWRLIVLLQEVETTRASRRPSLPFLRWGLFVGASLLLNPAHLLVVGAVLLLVVGLRRLTVREGAIIVASIALVVSPWIVRNSVALGHAMGIRSNVGYEVYRGLATSPWDPESSSPLNPGRNADEHRRYVALGEARYMAAESQRARAFALAEPWLVVRRVVNRVEAFWWGTPEVERTAWGISARARHLLFLLPAVAGLFALGVLWRRRRQLELDAAVLGVITLLVAIMPLPYYVTLTQPRYRAPIEPWFVLLIACASSVSWRALRPRPLRAPSMDRTLYAVTD
jgi:hypothetical protein